MALLKHSHVTPGKHGPGFSRQTMQTKGAALCKTRANLGRYHRQQHKSTHAKPVPTLETRPGVFLMLARDVMNLAHVDKIGMIFAWGGAVFDFCFLYMHPPRHKISQNTAKKPLKSSLEIHK